MVAEPASPTRWHKPQTVRKPKAKEAKERKDRYSAPADEALDFPAESKKHVHLDREPDQCRGRMDKSVGRKLPERCRAKPGRCRKAKDSGCRRRRNAMRQTAEHHAGNVRRDEQGRHIDRIASHPGDRPVIIGGSDSEHDLLVAAVYDRRKFSVTRNPAESMRRS